MKNLFIILIFLSANVQGQTTRVATSSSSAAPVVYTQAGVDAAIKRAVDPLASRVTALETKSTAQAALIATLRDSVKLLSKPFAFDTAFATVTKGVTSNTITGNNWKYNDLLAKYNSLAGSQTKVEGRLTPLEAAVKKIPTTATSVSTSTTTTTTNTTLQ